MTKEVRLIIESGLLAFILIFAFYVGAKANAIDANADDVAEASSKIAVLERKVGYLQEDLGWLRGRLDPEYGRVQARRRAQENDDR